MVSPSQKAAHLNNVAVELYDTGDYKGALEMYQEAFVSLGTNVKGCEQEQSFDANMKERCIKKITATRRNLAQMNPPFSQENETEELTSAKTCFLEKAFFMDVLDTSVNSSFFSSNSAIILHNIGVMHCSVRNFQVAEDFFFLALGVLKGVRINLPLHSLVRCSSLNNIGHISFCGGNFWEAEKCFSEAMKSHQDYSKHAMYRCSKNDCNQSTILVNQALALGKMAEAREACGILDEAMMLYTHASKTAALSTTLNACRSTVVYSNLIYRMGVIHYRLGDIRQSIHCIKCCVMLKTHVLGDEHPSVDLHLLDLGSVQMEANMPQEALESYEQCLFIRKKIYGKKHGSVAEMLYRIGMVCQELGDLNGALENFNGALQIERQTLGGHHHDVAITLSKIGQVHYLLGNLELALHTYQDGLTIAKQSLNPFPSLVSDIINKIGTIHLAQGNHERAVDCFNTLRRTIRNESSYGSEDLSKKGRIDDHNRAAAAA